ncbi:MAG: aldehyde dehydrogenase family protein, partial [Kiloniellales bacterium]
MTRNVSPSDLDDLVGLYARASAADAEAAVAAARAAFPAWSRTPLEQRQAVLDAIGSELIARKEELGRLLAREEGKTLAEGMGEVARSGQFFRYYAAEALRQIGDTA